MGSSKHVAIDWMQGTVVCYGTGNRCYAADFAIPSPNSPFYNEKLVSFSRRLNALLAELKESITEPNQHLEFVSTSKGFMLVFSRATINSDDSSDEEIDAALGISSNTTLHLGH
jgi:hypothetical protein